MQHLKQKTVHFFCAVFFLYLLASFLFVANPKGGPRLCSKVALLRSLSGNDVQKYGVKARTKPVLRGSCMQGGKQQLASRKICFFFFRGGGGFSFAFFLSKLDAVMSVAAAGGVFWFF